MKVLLIRNGSSLIAYVGGVEFNSDRLNSVTGKPGTPLFDISVRLQDAGAWLALDTFVNRWQAHPDATGTLRGTGLPIPLPAGGPLAVQVTHTYGQGFPFPNPVRTASAAISNGIRSAHTFFYMEDQYFVGSPQMDSAMRDMLSANPKAMGIIVIAAEECVTDLPDLPFRRRAFLGPLATAFSNEWAQAGCLQGLLHTCTASCLSPTTKPHSSARSIPAAGAGSTTAKSTRPLSMP